MARIFEIEKINEKEFEVRYNGEKIFTADSKAMAYAEIHWFIQDLPLGITASGFGSGYITREINF